MKQILFFCLFSAFTLFSYAQNSQNKTSLSSLKQNELALSQKIKSLKESTIQSLDLLEKAKVKRQLVKDAISSQITEREMLQRKPSLTAAEVKKVEDLRRLQKASESKLPQLDKEVERAEEKYNANLVALDQAVGEQKDLQSRIRQLETVKN